MHAHPTKLATRPSQEVPEGLMEQAFEFLSSARHTSGASSPRSHPYLPHGRREFVRTGSDSDALVSETSVKKCSAQRLGFARPRRLQLPRPNGCAPSAAGANTRAGPAHGAARATVVRRFLGGICRRLPRARAARSLLYADRMRSLAGALPDTQAFEKGSGPNQIGGSEALCKSVVHGLQKIISLTSPALLVPEACKTRCRS